MGSVDMIFFPGHQLGFLSFFLSYFLVLLLPPLLLPNLRFANSQYLSLDSDDSLCTEYI